MSDNNIYDQKFSSENYSENTLASGEYENCHFNSCIFAKADLRGIKFTACTFTECDFSMANLHDTGIRDCSFDTCKMIGIEFQEVNTFLFAMKAKNSNLNHSSFTNLNLKKCAFADCQFEECNFEGSNLSETTFKECNFERATFDRTDLRKTDLSSCINITLDLNQNLLNGAYFSKDNVAGLLSNYGIKLK